MSFRDISCSTFLSVVRVPSYGIDDVRTYVSRLIPIVILGTIPDIVQLYWNTLTILKGTRITTTIVYESTNGNQRSHFWGQCKYCLYIRNFSRTLSYKNIKFELIRVKVLESFGMTIPCVCHQITQSGRMELESVEGNYCTILVPCTVWLTLFHGTVRMYVRLTHSISLEHTLPLLMMHRFLLLLFDFDVFKSYIFSFYLIKRRITQR